MLLKADIDYLIMDSARNTPIVILRTINDSCIIPIWIGYLEAALIASALKEVDFDHPMTHELFKEFMDHERYCVSDVVIYALKGNRYYARIHFARNKKAFYIEASPSDAIALSLQFKAPIFVDQSIVKKWQDAYGEIQIMDQSDKGRKWAEYLQNLPPEKFGRYIG